MTYENKQTNNYIGSFRHELLLKTMRYLLSASGKREVLGTKQTCQAQRQVVHLSYGELLHVFCGHADIRKMSPHTDAIDMPLRYLRVRITSGIRGVWEWIVEEPQKKR